MKQIDLTRGAVAIVSDDDYYRVNQLKWRVFMTRTPGKFYAAHDCKKTINGIQFRWCILMHRFILNAPPHKQVDHRDNNGLNNTRKNLRLCTNTENSRAKKNKSFGKASRFRGVSWKKDKRLWRATIKAEQKNIHLGYFTNELDAARAYDAAAVKYYRDFSSPNFSEKKNMKEKKKHNPSDTESSGSNPIWPGEGLRKEGEKDEKPKKSPQGETTETTEIPKVQ
jgi:hypothetical protein